MSERERLRARPRAKGSEDTALRLLKRGDSISHKPLDPSTRTTLHPTFGHSIDTVRIHADSEADKIASELDARALTVGRDIYFRSGEYAPARADGRNLIAHELAHVVQQERFGTPSGFGLSRSSDSSEIEADSAASSAAAGLPAVVNATPNAAIARKEEEEESWLEKAAWFAGEHLPGIGDSVEAAHGFAEGMTKTDPLDQAAGFATAASGIAGQAAEFGGFELFGEAGLLGEGGGIMSALGGGSLVGEGGVVSTLMGAGSAGGIEGVAGTILPSLFGGAEGAAALPGIAGAPALEALGGVGLEGAAALGPYAAVAGAGLAGWEAGRGLDAGVNWLGQKITGDEKGDYSISGGLASLMTGADNMGTEALRSIGVLDESKPEYTQTLGWKLASLFD